MRRITLFLLSAIFTTAAFSQNVNCYRVYLHDKANTPYSINQPEQFLSQRCLDKRARYDIPVTEEDLPVNPAYLHEIRQASPQLRVLAVSRWLNTAVVCCPDTICMDYVRNLPFVDSVKAVGYYDSFENTPEPTMYQVTSDTTLGSDTMIYGKGYGQIALHNGHLLHAEGYHGEGMLIAMLDGGWLGLNNCQVFSNIYENGQIWGTYNFVPGLDNVYLLNGHGTECASTILSSIYGNNDTLVGTAPAANMVLICTEDPGREQPIEEDFWVAGVELADSLGADVISASIGYTQFSDSTFAYDYSSCDGQTTVSSIAATKAAHKGMVVCAPAGNYGDDAWHRVSRPGDAKDILCVGAVSVDSLPADFSGRGPSYDGRVKPDVASCGLSAYFVGIDAHGVGSDHGYALVIQEGIRNGSGTSFATPVIAGLAACLWQALPQFTALEIMQLIREAGHLHATPDTIMGFGIPDFYQIFLNPHISDTSHIAVVESVRNELKAFPNPVSDNLTIENISTQNHTIYIYSLDGKLVGSTGIVAGETKTIDASNWAAGIYLLQADDRKGRRETIKIIRR